MSHYMTIAARIDENLNTVRAQFPAGTRVLALQHYGQIRPLDRGVVVDHYNWKPRSGAIVQFGSRYFHMRSEALADPVLFILAPPEAGQLAGGD